MRDDHEARAEALARDLCERATLADVRRDADELAALVRAVLQPLPTLPSDDVERERVLASALLEAKDHARRLLALVETGM